MPLSRRQLMVASALSTTVPALAFAQAGFPSKAVRFIVPYPPGGIADAMARLLQPHMQSLLGQPVVVENRAGAGGNVGTDLVAKSPPDGHTILFGASGPLAVNKTLYQGRMPYDPERDLRGVAQLAAFPLVLMATREAPFNNTREFLAWLRQGERSYASAGNGTPQHLAAELVARSAGVKLTHVPYKGAGQAVVDIIPGRVPFMLEIAGGAIPHVRGGSLKAIAVTSSERLKALPDVPTLAESGLPGFNFTAWNGASVPAGTPDAVIARWNQVFQQVLREPAIQRKWDELGSLIVAGPAEQFDALVKSEARRLGALVTELGVTVD